MSKYTSLLARGRTRGQIMSVIKSSSVSEASKKLDRILEKQAGSSESKLDIRKTQSDMAYGLMYAGLRTWYMHNNEKIPNMDDPSRDIYLSDMWMKEPILAGAVYSMTAKMAAMRWAVTGRRLKARNLARILSEAAHFDGFSWDGFISSTAQDFYTTNRGVFWETPRIGDARYGKLSELGHIDALSCDLTGNKNFPVRYVSELSGQTLKFRVGEYIHFTSMPSPRERKLGAGFCAVDRAFRAVKLLMAVHDYDDEKLRNLPPEGIASVSGLTMDEFMDAIGLWKAQRLDDNSLTFPQVLWLIGSQPGSTVNVDIQGFSSLPESFDRDQVVSHYISTLALDFGVDAREFWPISSGSLGTASESEIQHLKAKGKGPGEFISIVERQINGEADEDTQFGFDTADIEEDQNAAINAKAWIDAYYPLYTGTPAGKSKASPAGKPNTDMVPDEQEIPKDSAANEARGQFGQMGAAGQSGPEQIITKDQILRLLADKGVIPEWMMNDQRMRVEDTSIHISKELDDSEMTSFVFEKGVLKERRLPPIILNSSKKDDDVPYAETVKSKKPKAPNYHYAMGEHKCMNCRYFRRYPNKCELYDFKADEDYVCDDWESRGMGMKGVDRSNGKDHTALTVVDGDKVVAVEHDEERVMAFLRQKELEIFEDKRNIRGDPIPAKEVKRGARITRNTVRDELERWKKHPILSQYVPTESEIKALLNEN